MLNATNLEFAYPGGSRMTFPGISCGRGEHCLILGASGSGKTTLLQLLAGLRTPTKGEVQIGETTIRDLSATELDRFRGNQIGMVFQQSHFMRALTIGENLALAQQLAGRKVDHAKIHNLLGRLGLGDKLRRHAHQLSVGEQQRVAIARALINDPAVILADEPTSALDDRNANEVISLLEEQASLAGATLVVVTHDARLKERFEKRIAL